MATYPPMSALCFLTNQSVLLSSVVSPVFQSWGCGPCRLVCRMGDRIGMLSLGIVPCFVVKFKSQCLKVQIPKQAILALG